MKYEKLRSELQKRGISIYRMAVLTGLNQSTLYNGFRYGTLFPAYRKKIADAIGETEEKLFTPEERGEKNGK